MFHLKFSHRNIRNELTAQELQTGGIEEAWIEKGHFQALYVISITFLASLFFFFPDL